SDRSALARRMQGGNDPVHRALPLAVIGRERPAQDGQVCFGKSGRDVLEVWLRTGQDAQLGAPGGAQAIVESAQRGSALDVPGQRRNRQEQSSRSLHVIAARELGKACTGRVCAEACRERKQGLVPAVELAQAELRYRRGAEPFASRCIDEAFAG